MPLTVFSKLYEDYEYAYILESLEGPRNLARYTFIGANPEAVVQVKNSVAQVENKAAGVKTRCRVNDPLQVIKKIVAGRSLSHRKFRFIGGAVGYVSYDAIRYWEKLPENTVDDLNFPDIEMGIFNDGIVFDHRERQAFYYYLNDDHSSRIRNLAEESSDFETLSFTSPRVNTEKEHFENSVMKTKKYISSGDIFQAVISKRYDINFKGDLIHFYKALRRINPSPYMYFLKMGNRCIIGSSPEMLMRVNNDTVETFPIAGTCPRTKDPRQNKLLATELLKDPKEQAEHVMLVDLARNDLGKVSRFGSVHLPEFMTVHQYSHVQHIVSRVVGKLRNGCSSYDALKAIFPAGTLSGAPKVRAMQIIDELEPTRRGPYAGAVGYFSFNGNADFAITIRTLISNGNRAYIQVGAGIVADSVPEKEWFETDHKAEALMAAIKSSDGERL